MAGGGPDLDSHTAQYQTRDLLRDAPLRLGACTMFVTFGLGYVFVNYSGLDTHWLVLAGGAVGLGILASILAARRAAGKDAIRVARVQADRSERKQAELENFLKDKT
tara:strand:+ start:158 stop:478 length:321 start_codon:yes stop_codon:yes gene_type:complete